MWLPYFSDLWMPPITFVPEQQNAVEYGLDLFGVLQILPAVRNDILNIGIHLLFLWLAHCIYFWQIIAELEPRCGDINYFLSAK